MEAATLEASFSSISSFIFFVISDFLVRGFLAAFLRLGPGDERRRFLELVEAPELVPPLRRLLGAGTDSVWLYELGASIDERLERDDRDSALEIGRNCTVTGVGREIWGHLFLG